MAVKAKDEPGKVGRKPRGAEAGSVIALRITADERETYAAAAAKKAMSVSEWIRDCCARILKGKKG
jgi:hypothetical protein